MQNNIMNKILYNIGLGFAVALLLCLLPMPYGYYMLIRFVAIMLFACMAYSFYNAENIVLCVVAIALLLLFLPIIKIPLGRVMWNVVDVIVAIGLIGLWFKNRN